MRGGRVWYVVLMGDVDLGCGAGSDSGGLVGGVRFSSSFSFSVSVSVCMGTVTVVAFTVVRLDLSWYIE